MNMARQLKLNKWLFCSVLISLLIWSWFNRKKNPTWNRFEVCYKYLLTFLFCPPYNCGQGLEGWQWAVSVYVHWNTALTDADSDSGSFTLGDGGQ